MGIGALENQRVDPGHVGFASPSAAARSHWRAAPLSFASELTPPLLSSFAACRANLVEPAAFAHVKMRKTGHSGAMSLDQPKDFVKHQTVTRDAFLGGRIIVSQPRNGFRAGLDTVLLGACASRQQARACSIWAAASARRALVALAHNPALRATPGRHQSRRCWRWPRSMPRRTALPPRTTLIEADVAGKGALRRAARRCSTMHYHSVIANPPFFDAASRHRPGRSRPRRRPPYGCRQRSISGSRPRPAAPRQAGRSSSSIRSKASSPLLAAFEPRFGAVTVLPLTPARRRSRRRGCWCAVSRARARR